MTQYRVATQYHRPPIPHEDEYRAIEMRDTYGLTMFTISEIITIWEAYSDTYAAGWMGDSKDSIETAFQVQLEEIEMTGEEK